jgi:hypothetical protein
MKTPVQFLAGLVFIFLTFPALSQQQNGLAHPKGQLLPYPEIKKSKLFTDKFLMTKTSPLFFEDFETGAPAWSKGGSWQVGAPTSGPNSGYGSANCAATNLSGNYPPNANDLLISPGITLPSVADFITLSFYEWFELESGYDYGKVNISIDNGATWDQLESRTGGQTSWKETNIDLTSYKGKTVKIAFQLTSDISINYNGWYVDDIDIESSTPAPLEAKMMSLNSQNFPLIYMNVAVKANGVGISTLTQSDFSVKENNILQSYLFEVTPPQSGGGSRIADIIFVLDVTSSMSEEIASVKNNMISFLHAIDTSRIDYRIGLVVFGDIYYVYNNYNTYSNYDEILSIFNNITLGEHEIGTGTDVPENQVGAMAEAANFHFRPGAQRFEIMLTDAWSHENDYVTTWTINTLINNRLVPNNIIVFPIFDVSFTEEMDQYIPIANATNPNGTYFNILDNFNDILYEISTFMADTYLVRYCSSDIDCDGITRNVDVIVHYDVNTDTATGSYMPCDLPIIKRTAQTVELHNQAWAENSKLNIQVAVNDSFPPYVTTVTLFYKKTTETTYSIVSMTDSSGFWSALIPSGIVVTPGVDYYISATDGISTVTDPTIEPSDNPYQLAVLPNIAPVITHTPITGLIINQPITINAVVFDNTNSVYIVKLFYKKRGQLIYQTVEMNNYSGNSYGAEIPGSFSTRDGVEYYISAWDNFGVRTDHGTAATPHIFYTLSVPAYDQANGTPVFIPNPFVAGKEISTVRFMLKETAPVSVRIYNLQGVLIKTLVENNLQLAGTEHNLSWDGTNDNGNLVVTGMYLCIIQSGKGEKIYARVNVLRY